MSMLLSILDNLYTRYYFHFETLIKFGAIGMTLEFLKPLVIKNGDQQNSEYLLDLLWSGLKVPFVFFSGWLVSIIFSPLFAQGIYFRSNFSEVPFWIECIIAVVIADFVTYWRHRLTHLRWLWPYHAVHHSSRHLHWLSNERFHPVNAFFSIFFLFPVMMSAGFSYKVMMVVNLVVRIANIVHHSNTRLHFGYFNYILVSPIFHRWHHSLEPEAHDKNFAVIFSFWDYLFGTFYLPKGVIPVRTGVQETIPNHLWGQFMYPFKVTWSQIGQEFRRLRDSNLIKTRNT